MSVLTWITRFGLAAAILLFTQSSFAWQTNPIKDKVNPIPAGKTATTAYSHKYKFDQASTLSGITLQPEKSSGTVLLKFDQLLTEPGTLLVKNSSGKVLYTNLLQPETERKTHTMNIGKLLPGLYSIEVKTAETTFWKKVRVRN
jgi:hypothetical protein